MNIRAVPAPRKRIIIAVAIVFVVAAVGYGLVRTRGADNFASLEAEAATRSGGAASVSDSAASGGRALAFASAPATPPPAPNPTPTPPSPAPLSGQAMPVGNLPGWRQIFTDDFTAGDVPLGGFPGSRYQAKWSAGYSDGTPDTAGKTNGGRSVYYPSKVLSVRNGMLDMYLHSEGGKSLGAAPMPKFNTGPGGWPPNTQTYGKYTVRFRADPLAGFKTAWLLWPDSDRWNDGEIDFPEGGLNGRISAFSHCVGANPANNCFAHTTSATYTSWHTADIEWSPGRVDFKLDGVPLPGSPATSNTPSKPMHYILQTESCLGGCPAAGTAGHLQIDWIAIYARN